MTAGVNNGRSTSGIISFRFWALTAGLVGVQLAWVVYVILARLGIHGADGTGKPLTFWLLWELASIAVTGVVTVAFWISCFMGKDGTALFEGSSSKYPAFGAILLVVFAVGFLFAAVCAWQHFSVTYQVLWLALGVAATIGLESLAMASTCEALLKRKQQLIDRSVRDKQKIASEVRIILGNRDNVTKYLCFSDVPIAFAILSIALGVLAHDVLNVPFREEEMRPLIAGAVAVQLLYSNFVFWLEAYAERPSGDELLDRLPPALRSVRQMLHPAGRLPIDTNPRWAKEVLTECFPEQARTELKSARPSFLSKAET